MKSKGNYFYIKKKQLAKNYTQIPNQLLKLKLTHLQKLVLIYLHSNAENFRITIYRIAEDLGCNWMSAKKSLDHLIAEKYIIKTDKLNYEINTSLIVSIVNSNDSIVTTNDSIVNSNDSIVNSNDINSLIVTTNNNKNKNKEKNKKKTIEQDSDIATREDSNSTSMSKSFFKSFSERTNGNATTDIVTPQKEPTADKLDSNTSADDLKKRLEEINNREREKYKRMSDEEKERENEKRKLEYYKKKGIEVPQQEAKPASKELINIDDLNFMDDDFDEKMALYNKQ